MMTTSTDRVRQVVVILAAVFCAYGTLVGLGLLGTRVEESSGGALAADATLLAPAGPAFSIWSLIYLGLASYTIWQALPHAASADRARTTGWLAAASMILNAGWLLVTQQGWVWASVAVIFTLVVVLGALMKRLQQIPTRRRAEAVVVDATFGLYLGWVTVATCANVTAALVDSGVNPGPPVADLAAASVLALAAVVGVLLARALGGRLSVAAAMTWGLGWIAVGRLADEPRSTSTAIAAMLAAAVVLLATVAARPRGAGTPHGPGEDRVMTGRPQLRANDAS